MFLPVYKNLCSGGDEKQEINFGMALHSCQPSGGLLELVGTKHLHVHVQSPKFILTLAFHSLVPLLRWPLPSHTCI